MANERIETDYFLALRPEPSRPDGPTVHQRMRSLLKVALRNYGFKCISIGPDVRDELPAFGPGLDVTKDEPPFAVAEDSAARHGGQER